MKCGRCGFKSPEGFAFCGKCGKPLSAQDGLTMADLEHLRTYLPPLLVEALHFDLMSPPPRLLEQCTAHLAELLTTIGTHLPAYLAEGILLDPAPGRAGGRFFDGTLLFADISGFTAVSERLTCIGREGAEEITSVVNGYFDVMLSVLREHGGQLIKFGGDALLGLFTEPHSATRAAQAAMSMQAAMAEFSEIKTSLGNFPLRMKVGLHKGRYFAAQLGAQQRMEYALLGADVNETAATESAAIAGQVLLDQATLRAIAVPYRAMPTGDKYFVIEHIEPLVVPSLLPPHSSSPEFDPTIEGMRRVVERLDAFAPYLPAGLLGRIVGDPHVVSQEGEHRLVAVAFTNVQGLGEIADRLGPGHEEQIVAALNHYFTAMAHAVHRFGGIVNKMDLNDSGDKLLAFFGAPVAHEDDAERAVRAALEMQQVLRKATCSPPTWAGLDDLRLSQHTGISYGYVFAGYVGTSWRHEYTSMGDEVNLAARLMSIAEPGQILVSASVRRKTQALFEFAPRGEVQLKGKSDLTPIFAVTGARAIPEPLRGVKGMTSPLVGRQAEWDQLQSAMDLLLTGRGQIVSVMGEAGLGKSRLAAEMRQQMRTQSAHGPSLATRWFEGRCLSYTESVSFLPFQEIVRQMAGIRQDDGEAEAWGKLRGSLETWLGLEEGGDNLAYLGTWLNLTLEDAMKARVRHLDAEALQRRMFVALGAFIVAQAKAAPLVLALEDIHWMDQASIQLVEYLMPMVNHAPLMLLLLYRPERSKGCWQIHEKVAREFAHCAADMVLHPLAADESQELLNNLVQMAQWPADMRDLILGRAEGNPLYLEEVLRALIDSRTVIQDDGGRWQIGGKLDASQIPDTLQGVMMARLDQLEESQRGMAQVASVIGRIFVFDVLAHIAPENGATLNASLVELQRHEIVRETQRAPELSYSFRHALMHEVCYQSLSARARRQYHCKIAEYLGDAASRRELDIQLPLIAHHAYAGQDWQRALQYQLLAGQQAQRLYANHEAMDHFEKALQSAENLPPAETIEQRQTIHAALGELLVAVSQYDRALEHLQAALAFAIEQADRDAQARACRWLARLHELRGEYPVAFEWIEKGLATLAGQQTTEAAELSLIAGLIHTRQGLYDQALDQSRNSLAIAQQLGEVAVLARAYNLLGHVTRLLGQSSMAVEHFERAFDLYRGAGDISGQALLHNQIANACADLGQWQAAGRHYCQAREIFDRVGDVYHRAMADSNLGEIALTQGRLDEALAFYQEALRSIEQIGGSVWMLGVFHNNLGHTFIRRGQAEAALQHLRASREYFEQIQARDFLPELHRHFAEAALLSGQVAEAEAQSRQALSLARELSMQSEAGSSLRVLGQVAAAQDRPDKAVQYLSESISILGQVKDQYEGARSQLALAQVYVARREPQQAAAALGLCRPVFERLEATLDLAAARSLQETILSARGDSPAIPSA